MRQIRARFGQVWPALTTFGSSTSGLVLSDLDPRADLAIRGATDAVCIGARMQVRNPMCIFCGVGPGSLARYRAYRRAMGAFTAAPGRPLEASLALVLTSVAGPPARI